jgi:hypothetical protein
MKQKRAKQWMNLCAKQSLNPSNSLLFLTKWKRNKKREEKLNTISPLLLALSEREKLPPNKYEGKVSKVRKYGWVGGVFQIHGQNDECTASSSCPTISIESNMMEIEL